MGVLLRPITPDDYPRMVDIVNGQVPEPVTVDDLQREDATRSPEDPFRRLGAVAEDGTLAGFGLAAGGSGHRPGEFVVRVRVDAPYRGRGIGRALYGALEDWTRQQGARAIESAVREEDAASMEWARRRGYATEHHLFESTLDLQQWDPAPWLPAVDRLKAGGIRFTTLAAEGATREHLRQYYDLTWTLVLDIPGNDGREPFSFDAFVRWVEGNPRWNSDGCVLAADGDRWVAVSNVTRTPRGAFYNDFTGVDRDYRGRGLALAVKVLALDWAQRQGAPYIRTNNHSVNAPMLAVNRKLGYVPLPGVFLLRKSLAAGGPAQEA